MSYDWKTPISREEVVKLSNVSEVAAMRGQLKAKERYTKLIKRSIQYQRRAVDEYQRQLASYYLRNFE